MRAILISVFSLLSGSTVYAQPDYRELTWSVAFEATTIRSAAVLTVEDAILAVTLFENGGVEALVVDSAVGKVLDRSKLTAGFKAVCTRNGMILLSGGVGEPELRLTRPWTDVVAAGSCTEKIDDALCPNGRILASHALPRGSGRLAICLPDGDTQPVYQLIRADGATLELGAHGPVPRRRGRHVLTETAQPSVFLSHHTVEVETTAVLIDMEKGVLTPAKLRDLSDTIPTRGLGAGRTETTITMAARGAILAVDRGAVVFLPHSRDTPQTLTKRGVSGVALFNKGCCVALVSQDESGAVRLEAFRICDNR